MTERNDNPVRTVLTGFIIAAHTHQTEQMMLVLSRRKHESILIGHDQEIIVTVTGVRRNGTEVQIGIDAPSHVPILRTELYSEWKQGQDNGGQSTEPGAEGGSDD